MSQIPSWPIPPNSGLVGHGVVGVVRHIGPRLVGGGGRGGALPAADVDRGEVLGHLGDLQMAGSALLLNCLFLASVSTVSIQKMKIDFFIFGRILNMCHERWKAGYLNPNTFVEIWNDQASACTVSRAPKVWEHVPLAWCSLIIL